MFDFMVFSYPRRRCLLFALFFSALFSPCILFFQCIIFKPTSVDVVQSIINTLTYVYLHQTQHHTSVNSFLKAYYMHEIYLFIPRKTAIQNPKKEEKKRIHVHHMIECSLVHYITTKYKVKMFNFIQKISLIKIDSKFVEQIEEVCILLIWYYTQFVTVFVLFTQCCFIAY